MAREIVVDTETTGLDPRQGHKVIEIAGVELQDLLPTGRTFHVYIDPGRDIDPDAQRVHGISRAFLAGKPKFGDPQVAAAFLAFVGDAKLVAHNAGFDRGFINHELQAEGYADLPAGRWIDTLSLAQKLYPGMYNSLDALCKRFKISLSEREKHGALVDAQLLAGVYLELRGGRERRLDLTQAKGSTSISDSQAATAYGPRLRPLVSRITDEERSAHATFIAGNLKDGGLWTIADLAQS